MIAAPPIDHIVQTIVDAVHPRRVLLFGSHVRGEAGADSDLDLMVEIDGEPDRRGRELQIEKLFFGAPYNVDAKVYATEAVTRFHDDPGFLIYTIVREGRVLYARPDVAGAPRVVREVPRQPESLASWIRAAEVDLVAIEKLTVGDAIPWDSVCFHAQQAAEKYLKALLVVRLQRPERTHNLTQLLAQCRGAGYELLGIDADCEALSRYATSPRYPDDAEALRPHSLVESRVAVESCARIVRVAKQALSSRAGR